MPLSEQEFRAWSYRDGGETYDRPNESGIAHRFPDEDSNDYVIRISKDGLRGLLTVDSIPSARCTNTPSRGVEGGDRLSELTKPGTIIDS